MGLLSALAGKNTGRPPVWLMRQAGRYMPQYQKIRKAETTERMFRTPELIREVTLLPIDLLGVDAAILFSDILILLDAFQIPWHLEEGIGPIIDAPIQTEADIDALTLHPLEETIPFVGAAIRDLKKELTAPLIGFCGAPFTLASYLIEGGPAKQLAKTRRLLWERPELMHKLLQKLTDGAIAHLRYQIAAGCDAVQVFESWGNWLGEGTFEAFSLPYLKQITEAITEVPLITFCKGRAPTKLNSALSVDWSFSLPKLRATTTLPLQGNLDPSLLYASPATIKQEVDRLLQSMANDPAFILNLGHGVLPDTPFDHVRHLVDAVR